MVPWKLVEAVFSRWWLLLIPIIAAPAFALMLSRSEPQYASSASVWVSRPDNVDPGIYFRTANYWESPAQALAQVIRDLLATESFRSSVADKAGIEGPTAADRVWAEVSVGAAGTNLISVSATSANPADAQALVSAVLEEYQDRTTEEASVSAQLQIDYFTTQLTVANAELEVRQTALNAYVEAEDPTPLDTQLQRLTSAVDSQQYVVDQLVSSLGEAQRSAAAAPQALRATFSVQDPASEPRVIVESRFKKLMLPIVALILGAAISVTYVYIAWRTDHSIRTSQDLVDLPTPLLGFVPQLRRGSRGGVLSLPPLRWLPLPGGRDYARNVAASISSPSTGEA